MSNTWTLGALATAIAAELHGDENCPVTGTGTLEHAKSGQLSFLTNIKYKKFLADTQASAVILSERFLAECPVNALLSDNPYLAYARAASLLYPEPETPAGIDPRATIGQHCVIDPTVAIGPMAVVANGVALAVGVNIGPGCVIGANVSIGEGSRLVANVTLLPDVSIGARVLVHPGVVIGSDGFGIAKDRSQWVKVPQLGSVVIGDDVEIGANTTIDCGAIEDTVIEAGVKLDNQIQVAHNVRIGANTVIAGGTGISGSTRIGARCVIGGLVGFVGHLDIADDVIITGRTLVTRSISKPGTYSSGMPAQENRKWRKTIAYMNRLEAIYRQYRQLTDRKSSEQDKS